MKFSEKLAHIVYSLIDAGSHDSERNERLWLPFTFLEESPGIRDEFRLRWKIPSGIRKYLGTGIGLCGFPVSNELRFDFS